VKLRLLAFAAVWATTSAVALLAPGCYGRNCEGILETYGTDAGQGRMLSPDIWESSPVDGKWLWFPRQHYFVFDISELGGRTPQMIIPYVSAQEEPRLGGNFTVGAGNMALISNSVPNRVDVRNDTCSDTYLRLVVITGPQPPGVPDAAAPTEADGPDAASGLDAGADADADAAP